LREHPEIKDYEFHGALASICQAFIGEKRGLGYCYNTESKLLSQFSHFTLNYNLPLNTLTEDVVNAWIARRPANSESTNASRFSIVKQLAEYMIRIGLSAYLPPCETRYRRRGYVPYIFTHDEIRLFFNAVDSMQPTHHSTAPRRHLIMPVLFRLLYCCGLRVSEAIQLRGDDVDLQLGILTIRGSKFGKSRYVPMSGEVTTVCADYAKTRLIGEGDYDWFFSAPDGGCYSTSGIYNTFREMLWKVDISHGGKGNGPRVHDFRHTFAVHCLQKWASSGVDLTTKLHLLRDYLGHDDLSSTEQYLRMTAEVYPEISDLMQEKYGYIIGLEADAIK
jgi:integrase